MYPGKKHGRKKNGSEAIPSNPLPVSRRHGQQREDKGEPIWQVFDQVKAFFLHQYSPASYVRFKISEIDYNC
jgi:hypothetical protein